MTMFLIYDDPKDQYILDTATGIEYQFIDEAGDESGPDVCIRHVSTQDAGSAGEIVYCGEKARRLWGRLSEMAVKV